MKRLGSQVSSGKAGQKLKGDAPDARGSRGPGARLDPEVERWIATAGVAFPSSRSSIIPMLQAAQAALGYLPRDAMEAIARHLGGSRRQLFEELDRPALKSLPAEPYQYAEWKQRRAGLGYHVEVAKHYYSVPHALAKLKLWAPITDRGVEVFHKGKRVAIT